MLDLIRLGTAHAVYQNTETDKYELWVVAGTKLDPKLIEQDDEFLFREDAMDAFEFAENEFEHWFDPIVDEDAICDYTDDEFDRWFENLPDLIALENGADFELPDPDEFRI